MKWQRLGHGLTAAAVALAIAGQMPRVIAAAPSPLLLAQATAPANETARPARPAPPGPAAHVEARIADLHRRLHITPAQEPQFKAFADVMRANAEAMEQLFQERAQNRDRTAPGQLHWYARLTTAHADATNKLLPVFDALYASLTDKQKKAADAAFTPLRQARSRHKKG